MAGAGPASFQKCDRIRKRAEYLTVQGLGRKLHSENFLVFARPSVTGGAARFGITVSKKVGTAVERNRVKRILREVCRRHKAWFPRDTAVVLVAKRSAVTQDYAAVERELGQLCARGFARR